MGFMLCSMLHQGAPNKIPTGPIQNFISAFSARSSRESFGMMPASVVQTFLEQMARHLNGTEYLGDCGIEDYGDTHWTVRFIQALGWSVGTVLPRLPFMESALYQLHTSRVRAALKKRGTPIGHGAGTGTGRNDKENVELRSRI